MKKNITVPIYKKDIKYGEESSTKKYKVKLSAPNMYEMFSAQPQNSVTNSYWMVNTSQADRIAGAIVDLAYTKEENPKAAIEVLIGHGMGSSKAKTWAMEGLSLKNGEIVEVFPYINKTIPKGEKVLVCSCESRGLGQIAGKPGIGDEVELLVVNFFQFVLDIWAK